MSLLTVGVFKTSRKKHEKRVPIHPDHFDRLSEDVRRHLMFESGYGESFGVSDEQIRASFAGTLERAELFQRCDVALLAKPLQADFLDMKEGAIHWGWPHCVQQTGVTQTAIDRRETLIAWEAMHEWSVNGAWQRHVFYRNNEIAGYAGVLHAMNLTGIDGNYGPRRKAVVISYGSVSQGAIAALQARGIGEITVFTHPGFTSNVERIPGLNFWQFDQRESGALVSLRDDGQVVSFIDELADADIVVNGVLQDTDHPWMFVTDQQIDHLKPGSLIVDISCDEGMGFSFARPTSFDQPIFDVQGVHYYAVDHTPSYLWNSASWEISDCLTPYLPIVMQGPDTWERHETIRRATEINRGVIQNPKILSFQQRDAIYPHALLNS